MMSEEVFVNPGVSEKGWCWWLFLLPVRNATYSLLGMVSFSSYAIYWGFLVL